MTIELLRWDTFALCYIKLYFNIVSGNSYSPSIGFDIRAKIRSKLSCHKYNQSARTTRDSVRAVFQGASGQSREFA